MDEEAHASTNLCSSPLRELASAEQLFVQFTFGGVLKYQIHTLVIPEIAKEAQDVLVPVWYNTVSHYRSEGWRHHAGYGSIAPP